MHTWRTLTDRSLKLISLLVIVALLIGVAPHAYASTDPLDGRYDKISDPTLSAMSRHTFGMTMSNTSTPVGSISFEFCANSPIIGDACIPAGGFDASGATLSSQTGAVGFSISPFSTGNHIILTRPASLPSGVPAEYAFDNIQNPSSGGTYYVRLQTFTSVDGTGLDIESGGVVFVINYGIGVAAEVPPYLRFCVSVTITGFDCSTANSYLIDMGEFSKAQPTKASSEFVVATNASFGFAVSIAGTTLTAGNNTIPALFPGGGSIVGTSQFGINLRANTDPGIGADPNGPGIGTVSAPYSSPNVFRFQSGDVVASSTNSSDNQKFTVSYLANIGASQAPGFYAATMTYICLANF